METPVTEEERPAEAKPIPWYTLNPAALGRFRLVRALLIGLIVVSFSIVPLWRLLWYFPVYAAGNFTPVRDTRGRLCAAWRWSESREIRVYQLPGTGHDAAEVIADGARALIADAGLRFTVTVHPLPEAVQRAYEASTVEKVVDGRRQTCLDFGKLESHLIELRVGDPHADMLVVEAPFTDVAWAHGMASFISGVAVLRDMHVNHHLGKHETGHLLGYLYHDSLPLFVIGYPWEGLPWTRDTLMMLYGESNDLSPRARDALRYFWRGMERRTGRDYVADGTT